jgi:hypothetical protein
MATPTTLMEDDDDAAGGGEAAPASSPQPVLRPVAPPTIRPAAKDAEEEEFDVLEVDDAGRPLGGQTDRSAEGSLSEEDAGGGTLLEQRQRAADEAAGREPGQSRSTARRREQKKIGEQKSQEIKRLRSELNETRSRLDELQGRVGTVEPRVLELGEQRIKDLSTQLDGQIATAAGEVAAAQRQLIEAWDSGDKAAMAEALSLRDKAFIKQTRLENTKANNATRVTREDRTGEDGEGAGRASPGDRRAVAPGARTERSAAPQSLPKAVQRHVDDFGARFDWYDPSGKDRDSRRVLMLDNEIANEGFDPATPEYWEELETRMREVLPKKFEDGDDEPAAAAVRANGNGRERSRAAVPTSRRGPMTTGASDRPAPGAGGKQQVRITPERKTALIQAGILGEDGQVADNAKFKRVLKQYADHDRANGAARP